jgi:hypothetical protein
MLLDLLDRTMKRTAAPQRQTEPANEEPASRVRTVTRVYDSVPEETLASDLVAQLAKLSDLTTVPQRVGDAEMHRLPLDPTAAFVLTRVDGASSIESILDGSPLGDDATLYILAQLLVMGALRFA